MSAKKTGPSILYTARRNLHALRNLSLVNTRNNTWTRQQNSAVQGKEYNKEDKKSVFTGEMRENTVHAAKSKEKTGRGGAHFVPVDALGCAQFFFPFNFFIKQSPQKNSSWLRQELIY